MTLPRELRLRTVGGAVRLVQRLVDPCGPATPVAGTTVALSPGAQRIEVVARPDPGFALELRSGDDEVTRIDWAEGVLRLDRRRSGATPVHPTFPSVESVAVDLVDGTLALTVHLDRCSVEVVAQDGLAVLTDLVFPTTAPDTLVLDRPAERRAVATR
jgi:levanase/fructan beta-fructosidase